MRDHGFSDAQHRNRVLVDANQHGFSWLDR